MSMLYVRIHKIASDSLITLIISHSTDNFGNIPCLVTDTQLDFGVLIV